MAEIEERIEILRRIVDRGFKIVSPDIYYDARSSMVDVLQHLQNEIEVLKKALTQ